jgi:transposase
VEAVTTVDPKEGPFTADQAAAELDVTTSTIHRWLRDGVLPGRQVAPGAPWQIRLTDQLRHKLKAGTAPTGWLGLADAAKRLGLSKARVADLVKAGKLKAVRAMRSCTRSCSRRTRDSGTPRRRWPPRRSLAQNRRLTSP